MSQTHIRRFTRSLVNFSLINSKNELRYYSNIFGFRSWSMGKPSFCSRLSSSAIASSSLLLLPQSSILSRREYNVKSTVKESASNESNMSTINPNTMSSVDQQSQMKGKGKAKLDDLNLELGIGIWEGQAIFTKEPLSLRRHIQTTPTSKSQLNTSASGSGSIASPISISSASPTPSPKSIPRPRAVPHFTSPLPRTTPIPASQGSGSPSIKLEMKDKPIHPFFSSSRTAPPTNKPRYTAHYTSTEASSTQSSQSRNYSQNSQSDSGIQSQNSSRSPSSLNNRRELDVLAEELGKLNFVPKALKPKSISSINKQNTLVSSSSTRMINGRSKDVPQEDGMKGLPYFHYGQYSPAPQVVYTSSTEEANDLLSCLKGNVLGFDLEWPPAGVYKMTRPDGSTWEKKIGMTWDPIKKEYIFGQGRTALMQFCDDKLIVLIHLGESMDIPNKAIEILRSPSIYKMGVQVNGDGRKLLRDFPQHFPSTPPELSLHGLLELSALARGVDPINTGPGSGLISLATLCRTYLGKQLDKDKDVRRGDWFSVLDQKQKDYAANDVYSSLQIYKKLRVMAEENNVTVDLDRYLKKVGSFPTTTSGGAALNTYYGARQIQLGEKIVDVPEGVKPPAPAQLSALSEYLKSRTIEDIAEERGIKIGTVE
nr:uncharacterized protein I206_01870 [Kwoniella pini CBS 10737]OCF52577.1 hypothetical protein I206_01870 [Kwoniella pini CBS 10737]